MKIVELERHDFPCIRPWIDPVLFRVFHAPVGDDQLERLLTKYRDGRMTDLGLKAVGDAGQILGFIHVVLDWANELAHIRQILVCEPARRRQGVGSAIMVHTLRACFDEYRLHRVQLFVDADNEGAVAFYRAQGFHADGLMREAEKIGERFGSWYCMSMLQAEWSAQSQRGLDARRGSR